MSISASDYYDDKNDDDDDADADVDVNHLDIVCVVVVGNNRSSVACVLRSSRCQPFTAALGRC